MFESVAFKEYSEYTTMKCLTRARNSITFNCSGKKYKSKTIKYTLYQTYIIFWNDKLIEDCHYIIQIFALFKENSDIHKN